MRGRPPLFNPGDEVEVLSPPTARSGGAAWHAARIDSRASNGHYLVVYPSPAGASLPPLLDTVRSSNIRRRSRSRSPPRTRPPRADIGDTFSFQPGEVVEVHTATHGFHGGWYKARVDSCRTGQYVVVHKVLTDASGPIRETVAAAEVRHCIPKAEKSSFAVRDLVEVWFKDGWWDGWVCQVTEKEWGVEYKVCIVKTKGRIACTAELLRRRRQRGDAGAGIVEKTLFTSSQSLGKATTNASTQSSRTLRSKSVCDEETLSELLTESKKTEKLTFRDQLLSLRLSKNAKDELTEEEIRWSAYSLARSPVSSGKGERELVTGKRRKNYTPQKCITQKRRISDMKASQRGGLAENHQESILVSNPSVDGHSALTTELVSQEDTAMKRIDGPKLPNMAVGVPCLNLLDTLNSQYQHDEVGTGHETLPSAPKVHIASDLITPLTNESHSKATPRILVNSRLVKGDSTLETELVTLGDPAVKILDGKQLSNMMAGIPISTPNLDNAVDTFAPLLNESHSSLIPLPFKKRSPVWKYINLEVIPKMRQHPHFQPLEQSPELEREGIAIGLMVTYENLMRNTGRLQMDSSCNNLDGILKSIIYLEGHGFEIQPLKAHLEDLVRVKSEREKLSQKKSAAEEEVLERFERREHLNAELEAVDKAVMALKQALDIFERRRSSLSVQKEECETIIAKLQADLRLAEEDLASCENAFQGLLSAAH